MDPAEPELLRALPDVPRWIEGRALLLGDTRRVLRDAGGWALRSESPGARLVVLVGEPGLELVREAVSDRAERELLCAPEDAARVATLLPGWRAERALLHELRAPERLAPADPRVRPLRPEDPLVHLGADLRDELGRHAGALAIHAAFADGRAASFAYAYWRTERWFDISIDTAAAYRRRGLARAAASALIRAEMRAGRRPVWGATESNVASLALAAGLGFEQVDELALFTEPPG